MTFVFQRFPFKAWASVFSALTVIGLVAKLNRFCYKLVGVVYDINWSTKARKQLNRAPRTDQKRLILAVDTLADLPAARNVKALSGHPYGYRLRVGNYRVLFDVDTVVRIIDIQEVRKRDDNTY